MALLLLVAPATAHEVQPAVADVEITGNTLRMEVRLTAEALLAGIDLNGLADTNDSPLSGFYDQLRERSPEQLEGSFRKAWPRLGQGVIIDVEGARVTPQITEMRVPAVGSPDLARETVLILGASLPEGTAPVQIGWWPQYGPLVVRQQGAGDDLYTGYLTNGALSDPLPRQGVAEVGGLEQFARYIVLGFEHIIPKGLDHILFVLGLFFFSLKVRPLLVQVTAFTLAHTATLAMAILGIVTVSPEIVEPLIAASIVYVAVENILRPQLGWWRTAVVFGFGLLHGLGFASVLGEIGLDPARLVSGLIGFNIGVELGQLAVIALAFALLAWPFGRRAWYRQGIAIPASVLIAGVGAWWFYERVFL